MRTLLAIVLATLAALATATAADSPIALASRLVPFAFGIDKLPPAEQIALCRRTGYDALVLTGANHGIKEFADLPEVAAGSFHIPAMLWWYTVDKPVDTAWLDQTLVQAARMRTTLWMVAAGKKTPENLALAVAAFRTAADRCREHKVQLVLYPHLDCTFESAEEALALWKRLERPEVRLSIHLCHELKAGNGNRLDAVIDQVAPLLALASISGADADARGHDGWETTIMPLDRGTYDVRPFLRSLAAHGYTGPMVLHTFGITDPPAEHFARSLARWNALVAAPAAR